jgi:hypothetical protein
VFGSWNQVECNGIVLHLRLILVFGWANGMEQSGSLKTNIPPRSGMPRFHRIGGTSSFRLVDLTANMKSHLEKKLAKGHAPTRPTLSPHFFSPLVTRVNSTNALDEGLRIREIGRRMNSKVKLVEIGVCRK